MNELHVTKVDSGFKSALCGLNMLTSHELVGIELANLYNKVSMLCGEWLSYAKIIEQEELRKSGELSSTHNTVIQHVKGVDEGFSKTLLSLNMLSGSKYQGAEIASLYNKVSELGREWQSHAKAMEDRVKQGKDY